MILAHFTTDYALDPQQGMVYQLNGESDKLQFTKGHACSCLLTSLSSLLQRKR